MDQDYYRRRLKANKMRRKVASVRSAIRNSRVLLRLALIALIVLFGLKVLKLGVWYLNPQLLLEVDEKVVKIEGNLITPKYKIVDLVRQTSLPHTQIFRLDTKEIEENISQLTPVKKVYVRRFWLPARLHITIEERTPVFVIAPSPESPPTSAITLDGILIDREYMPISPKFNAYKLITYGIYGDNYDDWDKTKVDKILRLTKALEAYSKQKVIYVDLRNPTDIYVKLEKVLIRFGEINATALNRAKWIATILPQTGQIKKQIKYIDLRWEDAHYIKLDDEIQDKEPKLDENQKEEAN